MIKLTKEEKIEWLLKDNPTVEDKELYRRNLIKADDKEFEAHYKFFRWIKGEDVE